MIAVNLLELFGRSVPRGEDDLDALHVRSCRGLTGGRKMKTVDGGTRRERAGDQGPIDYASAGSGHGAALACTEAMARRPITARARIGISGWRYPQWRGVFYPPKLAHAKELAFAASRFRSIEVNGSFYSLLRPSTYQGWHDATPVDCVFALKGSRYISHMLRLGNVDAALANFFASGVLVLGDKLGPVLWQLPPRTPFDPARIARFFERLPRTHEAAARLATKHDARLDGRADVRARVDRPIRYALEVRHDSFADPRFVALAREHRFAIVRADTGGRFPQIDVRTTDFSYARLHGAEELYVSGYDEPDLLPWAERIRADLARGDDAYAYFDNDVRARAPFDALALDALVRGEQPVVAPDAVATVTEEARTTWPAWNRRRA